MSLGKKILVGSVVLAMVVSMVGPASAETVEELQAQIAQLQAQLNALLQQLAQLQGGASAGACPCTFERNLYPGMSGDDVKCLQQYLNGAGYKVAETGPGSPGNETTYYGSLTRAAVKAWQDANGVEYGTYWGYFGPKSRAKYNEICAAPTPVCSDYTTEEACTGGGCYWYESACHSEAQPVPAADLTVELDPTSSAAGPIYVNSGVAGSANNVLTKVRFTAGANPVTISGLKVTKYGTVSDGVTDIARVKVYEGANLLGSRVLVTNKATFTFAPAISIPAGSSKTLDLVVDLQSTAAVTATVGLGIEDAADVTASVTASGTFPVKGNLMTISQATFGSITVSAGVNPPTTTPRVGENDRVLGNFVISTGSQEDVVLTSMILSDTGTTADGDITDIQVKSGTEVLGTAGAFSNRRAVISMNKSIPRGSSISVQVTGDITAGVGRLLTLTLVAPDAVVARGVTSGVYFIAPSANVAMSSIGPIAGGGLTMTPNVNSPTDDLVYSPVPQTIGIFDVRATGEDVIIQTADIRLVHSAVLTSAYNIGLYDKNGALISTTVSVPAVGGQQNPQDLTLSWTVKANTTEQLYVKAFTNVFTSADAQKTITVSIPTNGLSGVGVNSGSAVTAPAAGFDLPAITYRHTGSLQFALNTTEGVGPLNQAVLTSTAENYWTAVTVIATREDINITSLQFNDEADEAGDTNGEFVTCSLYERAANGALTNLDTQPWNTVPALAGDNVVFNNINAGAGITVSKGSANAKVLVVKCSVSGSADNGDQPRLDITQAVNVTATGAVSGIAIPTNNIAVGFAEDTDTRGQHKIFSPTDGVLYVKANASAPSGNISRSSTATVGIWDLTAKGTNITIGNYSGTDPVMRFTSITGGVRNGSTSFRLVDATTGTVYASSNTTATNTTVTFVKTDFDVIIVIPQDSTVSIKLQEDITSAAYYPQYTTLQFGFVDPDSTTPLVNEAINTGSGSTAIYNAGGLVDYPESGLPALCPEVRIQ